jgi:hypothetical protein
MQDPFYKPVNGTVQLVGSVLPTSPAWEFMQMIWVHGPTGSWERLRLALQRAAKIAIDADFKWDAYTLAYLSQACSRWNACHGHAYWHADEEDYAYAVTYRGGPNTSFLHAYEEWKGRKPFILKHAPRSPRDARVESLRIHVRARFAWEGTPVRVTSFKEDGLAFHVVTDPNPSRRPGFDITREMLRAHNETFKVKA